MHLNSEMHLVTGGIGKLLLTQFEIHTFYDDYRISKIIFETLPDFTLIFPTFVHPSPIMVYNGLYLEEYIIGKSSTD